MTAEVETLTSQELSPAPDVEAKRFYFKFIRYDDAWVACFVPNCETPIKYGWSDIDIKTGRPAGYIVKSVLLEDQVSYRPASANGYSHFSAQPRMVVDLKSASTKLVIPQVLEEANLLVDLFKSLASCVKLDDRYLDRIRLYIGACDHHRSNLKALELMTAINSQIDTEIIQDAINT